MNGYFLLLIFDDSFDAPSTCNWLSYFENVIYSIYTYSTFTKTQFNIMYVFYNSNNENLYFNIHLVSSLNSTSCVQERERESFHFHQPFAFSLIISLLLLCCCWLLFWDYHYYFVRWISSKWTGQLTGSNFISIFFFILMEGLLLPSSLPIVLAGLSRFVYMAALQPN